MKKLDEFFNKRLTDYSEAEDGWNVPNDAVWEKASEHFPKKKKRKFLFMWLLFTAGLGLGFIGGYGLSSAPSADHMPVEDVRPSTLITEETPLSDLKKSNRNEIRNDAGPIAQMGALEKKENKSSIAEVSIQEDRVREEKVINNSSPISEDPITNDLKMDKVKRRDAVKSNTINAAKFNNDQDSQDDLLPTSVNAAEDNVRESVEEEVQEREAIVVQKLYTSDDNLRLSEIKPQFSLFTPFVTALPVIKPYKGSLSQREFGLTHKYFLLSLVNGVNLQEDPRDNVYLTTHFDNFNVHYRKWIKPRWSLQTGFNYIHLQGNFDFSIYSKIAEGDGLEEYFELTFEDLSQRSGIELRNDQSSGNDLPVVMDGDEINISGLVDFDLEAIRLPLMLHYHWYKRKFEFLAGAGLSLDYVWGGQSATGFKLEHEDIEYPVMLEDEVIESNAFTYSAYLNGAMKYHITENINVELGLQIAPISVIFTNVECGIYYRWNR